jgi:4-hydroxy-4-methyl-2-oxoglutarate aldolase
MIEDPPLLTLRGDFPRPPPGHLEALTGVQTGFVADAMGGRGGIDHRIKPIVPLTAPLLGTAMTCHCGPADNLALFGALASAQPGDILVAATDGFTGTAVTGDLLLGMARNRGLAGLVTDGLARDLAGIIAVGLPVFCAGLTPNSPARNGPGTVGLGVVLGGVRIESGDILVGDSDGVMVIPRGEAAAVIARLAAVRAAEAALEAEVRAGLGVPDFISSLLASGRVIRRGRD